MIEQAERDGGFSLRPPAFTRKNNRHEKMDYLNHAADGRCLHCM